VRWRVSLCFGGKRKQRFFRDEQSARDWVAEVDEGRLYGLFWQRLKDSQRLDIMNAFWQANVKQITLTSAVNGFRKQHTKPLLDVLKEYNRAKIKQRLRSSTLKQIKLHLADFGKHFGNIPFDSLTVESLAEYLDTKRWEPSTVDGVLNKLGPLFTWATGRQYYSKANPVTIYERPKIEDKAVDIFTVEEARRLLARFKEHDPKALPYLTIGLFAGIRPDEIQRLIWKDVSGGYIHVAADKSKTRKRRLVRIEENLKKWLALGGDLPLHNKQKRLAAHKGRWSADIMRHSFASYHLAAYEDAGKTAHELGHRDSKMLFRHYRELVTKEAGNDYFNISPLF